MPAFHRAKDQGIGIQHIFHILHLGELRQVLLGDLYPVDGIVYKQLCLPLFIVNYGQSCSFPIPCQDGIIRIDLVFPGTNAVLQNHFPVYKIGVEGDGIFTLLEFNNGVSKAAGHRIGIKANKILFADFLGYRQLPFRNDATGADVLIVHLRHLRHELTQHLFEFLFRDPLRGTIQVSVNPGQL